MNAIVVAETGPPEVLRLQAAPDPEPGPGQVLVAVEAAGVNFGETQMRAGTYPLPMDLPATPGSEVAGTVAAVGPTSGGTGPFEVRDRVAAMLVSPEGAWLGGGYAEAAVVDAARAVRLPDGVEPAQALALFGQGLTAHWLVSEAAPVEPGHTVLVHGAAGGVGQLALQLARLRGAERVFGTTRGAEGRALVESHGATPLDSDGTWDDAVRDATGGRGVDVALDAVGGPITGRTALALVPHGRLVFFGSLSGAMPVFGPEVWGAVAFRNLTVRGFANMAYVRDAEATRTALDRLLGHLTSGRLRVDTTAFPLAAAAEAHRAIEDRETIGKVVLVP